MRAHDRLRTGGSARVAIAVAAVLVAAAGVTSAVAASPAERSAASTAAARSDTGPITLVFAGQLVTEGGIEPFVDPYPPIEGGAARRYEVPAGRRLVIESVYVDVYERWTDDPATTPRNGIAAGLSTFYDLGSECAYPGFERDYGVPLTDPVQGDYDNEHERLRSGDMSGPIFVEGGRSVVGMASGLGGISTVYVHVTVHGHLERANDNPIPPVCGV